MQFLIWPAVWVVGLDLLRKYKATVQIDTGTLILDSPVQPQPLKQYVTEAIYIPSLSKLFVPVRSSRRTTDDIFVRSHNRLLRLTSVFTSVPAAKGIIEKEVYDHFICLANLSNITQAVPSGTIVAQVETIHESGWAKLPNEDLSDSAIEV
jgi:hypothetical protein